VGSCYIIVSSIDRQADSRSVSQTWKPSTTMDYPRVLICQPSRCETRPMLAAAWLSLIPAAPRAPFDAPPTVRYDKPYA
jgi:hypothetical protein